MKTRIKYFVLLSLLFLFIHSCKEDTANEGKTRFNTCKIAIVLPARMHKQAQEIASWVEQQARNAQIHANVDVGISLSIDWYDEDYKNLETNLKQLANNDQVKAIVGFYHSTHVKFASDICKEKRKALILPTASSAEVQRSSTGLGYLWFLSESDITQCEILLTTAMTQGAKKVSLLAHEDEYGNSFIEWFGFQAEELGLEIGGIYIYDDNNIPNRIEEIGNTDIDCLLCIPSTSANVVAMDQAIAQFIEKESRVFPNTLYSDIACSSEVIDKLGENNVSRIEGITMSSNPSSGFSTAYKIKFGKESLYGEAHLFDALMLLYYGLFELQQSNSQNLNNALSKIVDGRETSECSWMQPGMSVAFQHLSQGIYPDISGASGTLNFDSKVHTSVIQSVYAHWCLYNRNYLLLNYLSSDGGKRTESTLASWNWLVTDMQNFDNTLPAKEYPELKDKWAVLIATSTGWLNYRHQADVLAMYDLLRRHGYQDDHIILIMQDDIAQNPKNPEKGVIRVTPDGKDLYEGVRVDYHLDDLLPTDLEAILSGQSSDKLPAVIHPTKNDDVFIFWSGHGEKDGYLCWGDYNYFRRYEGTRMFKKLGEKHQYRKILFAIEACYSGSFAEYCINIPDMLFITAANPYETSKADIKNDRLGIYMSNGFTRGFQEAIDQNSSICLRDLYYKLARNTFGSHVTVYNEKAFGNLYKSYMSDFLD